MVLQSPIYKAPSIPKMGKKSSPLSSSSQKIESAVKGPELKTSKMSFIKGLGISIITAESLKSVEKPVISTHTLKIVEKIILKPEKSKEPDKEVSGVKPKESKEPDKKELPLNLKQDTSKEDGDKDKKIKPENLKGPDKRELVLNLKLDNLKGDGNKDKKIKLENLKVIDKKEVVTLKLDNFRGDGNKDKKTKSESLKGPDTPEVEGLSSITSTLTETNLILVEIQKQLALDFDNRIVERKEKLRNSKRDIRKKKLSKKEKFVEKSKGLGSGIKKIVTKVVEPIKGIFDRIIEFLTLVGTGILVNSIWTWLQDKENRDKVVEVFAFLKNYWKEIFFTILTLAVIKKIVSLLVFANRLRKLFNLFRGNKPNVKGPPGGCGAVVGCGKAIVAAIVTAGALALLGKKLVDSGTVAKPIPVGQPIGQPVLQPSPITADPIGQGLQDIENMPDGILGALANIGNSREFQIGSLLAAAGVAIAAPEPISTSGGLAAIGPLLAKLKLALSSAAVKGVAIGGVTLAVASPMTAIAKEKGMKVPPENEVAEQVVKYFGLSKEELLEIYKNKNTKLVERIAAEKTLTQQYNLKLDPPEFSRGGIIPGMPSMQDTIHALLAKGEFVINSMSTKMFKPFLYAINNNAGRLFKQFIEGVNLMKKNNKLSEELTQIQFVMVKKLNKQVEELVEREKEKKRKELARRTPTGNNGGPREQTTVQSNQSPIQTNPKPIPIKIETYNTGKNSAPRTNNNSNSAEGKTSVVEFNVTQPAIQLAGQETPEPVPTESSERSQTSITISSTDSSNPYIMSSYVNYGIDV